LSDAAALEQCIADGGVALFPTDTVYGLACDPNNRFAVERLYLLKRRSLEKPSAVMFFDLEAALTALPELSLGLGRALRSLMPGGVTVLLPNPARRYPLACRADPSTLGLRVVDVQVLRDVGVAVLQSSANPSGGVDARTLAAVTPAMRAGVNLEVDGGELPGVASTVIDLREYEAGRWSIVRQGLVAADAVRCALG
jgi:L-threonylcarbamoyladenylate synthase